MLLLLPPPHHRTATTAIAVAISIKGDKYALHYFFSKKYHIVIPLLLYMTNGWPSVTEKRFLSYNFHAEGATVVEKTIIHEHISELVKLQS